MLFVEDVKDFHEYTNEDKYEKERNSAMKNFIGSMNVSERVKGSKVNFAGLLDEETEEDN